MADMSRNDSLKKVLDLLEEMKAVDVVCLKVTELCSWTDYLIVAGTTSSNHMRGIFRRLREDADLLGLSIHRNQRMNIQEEWTLFDGGDIVINLMSRDSREFFELENRWFGAEPVAGQSSSSS
jgi:ribosome-associated protein